jgi:hypothetical protein
MTSSGPAKRCACLLPEPYRIDERLVGCRACGGWFSIEITTLDELERLRRTFPPDAAD